MIDNHFFKPTSLYKEFILLDLISKDSRITQRMLSEHLNIAVSLVNKYINDYEKKGYLIRNYQSSKTVDYIITKKGIERKNLLNLNFLRSSQLILESAKENVIQFINKLKLKGYEKILFYGAGEVAEIMLFVISKEKSLAIEIVGIIDDDVDKIGKKLEDVVIIGLNDISKIKHDGVMISSYANRSTILKKLTDISYPKRNILDFF